MSVDATRKQIRGSGLLLSGRILSLGLNLFTQVLIVRYLSKTDFGLFAYAMAIVSTLSSFSRLGMDRTAARFVPIYDEQGDRSSAAGAILLALGITTALGLSIVATMLGFSGLLSSTFIEHTAVINILIILIALAPVEAVDALLQDLFAALGRPNIIFFRKYIFSPCLKLGAIALTIAISGDVQTLAVAHVFAGLVSLMIYAMILPKVLREHGLWQHFRPGKFSVQFRPLFRYALPVFTADMADALRLVLVIAILEYFRDLANVADYRAVIPIARLNSVVLIIFSMLFLPMAARLFAQKNTDLLGEIQSHVGLWVTVLSFPIFAACIGLAEPLLVLLIGERYAASAPVLALLALGHFFKSALGLNRQSLRALGRVKVLLYIEIITTVVVGVAAVVLVPGFGAVGGALATTLSLIMWSVMNTFMLWRVTGTNPLPWTYARVYLLAAVCALALWLVNSALGVERIIASISLVALASAIVLISCWKLLRFTEIFPEIGHFVRSRRRKS